VLQVAVVHVEGVGERGAEGVLEEVGGG